MQISKALNVRQSGDKQDRNKSGTEGRHPTTTEPDDKVHLEQRVHDREVARLISVLKILKKDISQIQ